MDCESGIYVFKTFNINQIISFDTVNAEKSLISTIGLWEDQSNLYGTSPPRTHSIFVKVCIYGTENIDFSKGEGLF